MNATQERRDSIMQRVIALTREGRSAPDIAGILGISARSVTRYRVRAGISKGPQKPLTDDQKAFMARLLEDGCSYREVARTLGIAMHTVQKHHPGQGWTYSEGCGWRWGL